MKMDDFGEFGLSLWDAKQGVGHAKLGWRLGGCMGRRSNCSLYAGLRTCSLALLFQVWSLVTRVFIQHLFCPKSKHPSAQRSNHKTTIRYRTMTGELLDSIQSIFMYHILVPHDNALSIHISNIRHSNLPLPRPFSQLPPLFLQQISRFL